MLAAAGIVVYETGWAQDQAKKLPEKYPSPRPPTVLIPEAPTVTAADAEVDTFLQIPTARANFNVTGKGLCVVVIDSGINTAHISFAGRLIPGKNFSDDGGENDMRDTGRNNAGAVVPNGHGSNVAGIIAGNKLAAFEQMPAGIAHDAKIVPLKVFPGGQFDKINEALQWVLDNRENVLTNHGALISVVNMSLGVEGYNTTDDSGLPAVITAQRDLIKQLRAKNIAVVVSSGNSYASTVPNAEGMSVPGIFKETTSVAAIYDTNLPANVPPLPRTYIDGGTVKRAVAGRLTVFSQRLGEASGAFRTDICGPGFFVTSAGPEVGPDPARSRTTQDGTSQAAPTISGMIILAQQRWRDRKLAAEPATFDKHDLPTVDVIEKALRDGGTVFQDAEDAVGVAMDDVTSTGGMYHRANAVGLLNQIDLATSTASPSDTPTSTFALQALQAELFGKSAAEQKQVVEDFRKAAGKFSTFKKK